MEIHARLREWTRIEAARHPSPSAAIIDSQSVTQGFVLLKKRWVVERAFGWPHKKPRGKELTESQKQENRAFSRQRVKCEQPMRG